jgi:hypothetical protein
MVSRPTWGVLAFLALALAACAHAPTSEAEAAGRPRRVVVTGSLIPQDVDVKGGLPATISPVVIYSRDELMATGRPGAGAALADLASTVLSTSRGGR